MHTVFQIMLPSFECYKNDPKLSIVVFVVGVSWDSVIRKKTYWILSIDSSELNRLRISLIV